jgi:hypothetical protein
MSVLCFLCFLLALHLQCVFCFFPGRHVSNHVFATQQVERREPARGLYLCIQKSSKLNDLVLVNDGATASAQSHKTGKIDELVEEPPFSSGFVPLLRAILPKPSGQDDKRDESTPPELIDDGHPPSSATTTLSRYSRGFIPILRSLFKKKG